MENFIVEKLDILHLLFKSSPTHWATNIPLIFHLVPRYASIITANVASRVKRPQTSVQEMTDFSKSFQSVPELTKPLVS